MGKMKKLFIEEQQRVESLGFNPNESIDEEYFLEKEFKLHSPTFDLPRYELTDKEREWMLMHELAQLEAQKRYENFIKDKNLSTNEQIEEIAKEMLNLSDEKIKNENENTNNK